MNLGLKNKMAFQGTVVSNAFIDTYMTSAMADTVTSSPSWRSR